MATGILGAIVGILAALPEIIRIVGKIIDMVGQNKLKGYLSDVEQSIDQLQKAQSPEEKRAAARGMLDLIAKLG